MSHFVNIKTTIKDGNALVAALKRMGFKENEIEVSVNKAKDLYDYMGRLQGKQANVIIRQAALKRMFDYPTNDSGFRLVNGTFEAVMDDGYLRHVPKWMEKLTQFYGVEKAKAELTRKRIAYVEDLTDKNCPRLLINNI